MNTIKRRNVRLDERDDEERGSVTIVVALVLVALLIVAALVLDGGQAYAQRRQMQNAADAASMAGTRALDEARFSGGSATAVQTTVQSVATENGAETFTCNVIRSDYSEIGPCSVSSNVTNTDAVGVQVEVTDVRQTAFGNMAGRSQITARTEAAATIQPLVGSDQPFILCGSAIDGYNILNPDNTINAAAAQALGVIPIQSSQVPGCGAGSSFKGKKGGNDPITSPGWAEGNNGNGYEQDIRDTVLGGTPCPTGGPFDGCDMLVPIADAGTGNGNNTVSMHIVAWAVFHITGDGLGDPKYYGEFVADLGLMSSGQGGTGTVTDASQARVIKLVL